MNAGAASPALVDDRPGRRSLALLGCPAFSSRLANPFQALLYEEMQRQGAEVREFSLREVLSGRYDVVHVHWPEREFIARSRVLTLAKALRFFGLLAIARSRNARIVWTAHNLKSHEQRYPRLEGWLWRLFYRFLSGIISLNQPIARRLTAQLPHVPMAVIPHGHYRGAYPRALDHRAARARLGLAADARVFAFLGQIKAYKGVLDLADAWRQWNEPGARLLIAGHASEAALERGLAEAAKRDTRIHFRPGWLGNDELTLHLEACDAVVLPFRAVANSGSALLALSFDRPVLLPRTATTEELQGEVGHDWVYLYDGVIRPEVLDQAQAWLAQPRGASAPLEAFAWPEIAARTCQFFLQLRHET